MKKTLFLIAAVFFLSNLSAAQENSGPNIIVKVTAGACELNSLHFDIISNIANYEKERVFAIFRAGKGETESVNAKRLAHVKMFLENQKGWKWKSFNVIYARGEKSDGEGKIEFYIGGKLFLVVMSPKNKTLCLDCCDGGFTSPQNLVKKRNAKRKS